MLTSATSTDSRSAFTKPLDEATGSVSATCNGCCCVRGQPAAEGVATRQVTQDNRGKRTPGVDGVASLKPEERLTYAHQLRYLTRWTVDPIRRTYIPKPNNPTEKRSLGIPTLRDRAMQALVKLTLEPEWEAVFEPNSYGFRPGRSTHDAIEAIFNFIRLQPKYVLDADIEKCFDRISHDGLLAKLHAPQPVMRLIRAWLQAGIMEDGKTLFPEAGTPQGGVLSPLLANIALHGFEMFVSRNGRKHRVVVIRYADDFVILCDDLDVLLEAKSRAESGWLKWGCVSKSRKPTSRTPSTNTKGTPALTFLVSPSGSTEWANTAPTNATPDTRPSSCQAGKPCSVTYAS